MHDEDGVKGCLFYRRFGDASCEAPTNHPICWPCDPQIMARFTIPIVPPSRCHAHSVRMPRRNPIKHAESSWRPGKHSDSPKENLGDIVTMSGGG
jgi:hypothetical protein